MRTKMTLLALSIALGCSTSILAKDIKTVVFTTQPEMHCASCENNIKNNVRFVKGVKAINTDLKTKLVTVKYDADKTSVAKIIDGFNEIEYKATPTGGTDCVICPTSETNCETKKECCQEKASCCGKEN